MLPYSDYMEYQVKKLPKSLVEIEVNLSAEEMQKFYQDALKEMAQETTVSGFRPGKAPIEMVERQIGKIKILERAAETALNQKFYEIADKDKLMVLDHPKTEILKLAPDNPFVFKLTAPLAPQIKICDYKKIKVQPRPIKIGDGQVGKALKELQQMRRKESLVLRPAVKGDRVEVDLEMFLDKVPLEGGQIKNFSLILGEDFYIPGLSDNLVGLKTRENKEFSLQYPETHYDKKLAGRTIEFKVKINNLYQIELPEVNDDLAKSLGNFKTVDDLRQQLSRNLEEEAREKEEERQEIDLLRQLITQSEFEELPELLIEGELDKILAELQGTVEQQNLKFEDYLVHLHKTVDDLRKEFVPKAVERVKTALAIRKIAAQDNISVSEDEINQEIERLSVLYKNEPDVLAKLKSESGRHYLSHILLNKKVIVWLKERVSR